MRRSRALTLPALFLLLVACSGPAASQNGGTDQSDNPTPTAGASTGGGEATPTEGGGGAGGDLDSLVEQLTPPNSTESSRVSQTGGIFVGWESTDSVDSLKSFYEGAIPATGMQIVTTQSASGTFSWIFAESEGSTHGGSVVVAPSSNGGSGATVVVTVTSG
jgi:hypothetical protein